MRPAAIRGRTGRRVLRLSGVMIWLWVKDGTMYSGRDGTADTGDWRGHHLCQLMHAGLPGLGLHFGVTVREARLADTAPGRESQMKVPSWWAKLGLGSGEEVRCITVVVAEACCLGVARRSEGACVGRPLVVNPGRLGGIAAPGPGRSGGARLIW